MIADARQDVRIETRPKPLAVQTIAYHEILPAASRYAYECSAQQFREHLQLLTELRCAGLHVHITFDDGYSSNIDYALPLLREYALRATFFILAGPVGRSGRGLSWTMMRTLLDEGHQIGSHGWSHRLLTTCSDRELRHELRGSRDELQDRLGHAVRAVSMPGGRWDRRVASAAVEAGYQKIFHSDPWLAPLEINDTPVLGRLMITRQMSSQVLGRLLSPSRAQRLAQRVRAGAKRRLRRILGDARYHELWCSLSHCQAQGFAIKVTASTDQPQI